MLEDIDEAVDPDGHVDVAFALVSADRPTDAGEPVFVDNEGPNASDTSSFGFSRSEISTVTLSGQRLHNERVSM